MRHRPPRAFHRVVQDQAGPDVGPLDHLLVQRVHEGNRLDQVRGELGYQQVALTERLVDQLEVQLLQVAQPAGDELARPARGARSQISRFHQGDPQASGSGVQGSPRARDAPPMTSTSNRSAASLPSIAARSRASRTPLPAITAPLEPSCYPFLKYVHCQPGHGVISQAKSGERLAMKARMPSAASPPVNSPCSSSASQRNPSSGGSSKAALTARTT